MDYCQEKTTDLETLRLEEVHALHLLDQQPDSAFQDLVEMAHHFFQTGIVFISLIDDKRQWFVAKKGIQAPELPIALSVCMHAIKQTVPLIIENTKEHTITQNHPLVIGKPNIQFYASAPIFSENGLPLGTFCLMDFQTRDFSEGDRSFLVSLAKQAGKLFALNKKAQLLETSAQVLEVHEQQITDFSQQLNAYFNSTNDVFVIFDLQNTIISFNKMAVEYFLEHTDRVVQRGDSIFEYAICIEKTEFYSLVERAHQGEICQTEILYGTDPARAKWLQLRLVPIKNPQGEITSVGMTCIDIDDKKRADQALLESEMQLSLVLMGTNDGWWDWDLEQENFFISDPWTRMLGYTALDVETNRNLLKEIVHPDDRTEWAKIMYNLQNQPEDKFQLKCRMKTKWGHYIHVETRAHILKNAQGKAIRVTGANTDISELVKAENILQENQHFLTKVIENLPGFSYRIKADADGTFEFLSDRVFQMTGYSVNELTENEQGLFNLLTPETQVDVTLKLHEAAEKRLGYDLNYPLISKAGEIIWVWDHGMCTYDLQGNLTGFEGFITDITQRKREEESIKRSEEFLRKIFEVSPIALVLFTVEDGRIILANSGLEQLFGLQKDQVWGRNITDHMASAKELKRIKALIGKNKKINQLEIEVKDVDGKIIPCLLSVEPIEISGEEFLLSGLIDITSRKQVETKLRDRERLLQDMAANVPGAIFQWVISSDQTSYFEYMSAKLEELFGIEIHINDTEWAQDLSIPPEEVEGFYASIQHAVNTVSEWNYEGRIVGKDGTIKWFEGKSQPSTRNNQLVFNGIMLDITSRKLAEEQLLESEQILKNIFEFSPIPLLISKVDSGEIILSNEGMKKLLGLPKLEGSGTPVVLDDFLRLEDRVKIMSEILRKGRITNFEVQLKTKRDTVVSCLTSTKIITMKGEKVFLTALNDISERKAIEDALQQSENNLRTVFENTDMGYILVSQDLSIISYNLPAQEFSKREYKKPLLEGNLLLDYFLEHQKDEMRSLLAQVLNGQAIHYQKHQKREKDDIWYDFKMAPVANKANEVIGFIFSVENITDRKKDEIVMNQSFEMVSQQNKRLLNFSYIISHNLRSHTSNILSLIGLLRLSENDTERLELVELLDEVSQLLNETILNLNDVVSIQTDMNIIKEELSLDLYVHKALTVLSDQILSKKVKIVNNITPHLAIWYNPAYLESILFNFISNAIKYASPGRQPVVTLTSRKENDRLVISVADNGIGIDLNKNKDKLFGMYKTFHGNKDARGIGLFITKNQVESMGGYITVESTPGEGTTFHIFF